MSNYNTNLASEFYVLSTLYRLGFDAVMTLGNKKMVDIIVTNNKGDILTIDIKGISKKYDWPADNIKAPKGKKPFIVLVCYDGKIEDATISPLSWIIPYGEIEKFVKQFRTRKKLLRSLILKKGDIMIAKNEARKLYAENK